jgi:S1-C subfamily serine protease
MAAASAAAPSNLVPTPPDIDATQPGAVEIPAAAPADASQQQSSPDPVGSHPADSQASNGNNDVARYQEEQSGIPPEQMKGIQQFDSEGELSTPFGMQLREAKRTLKSGEDADGLLITVVEKDSPAAAVGLRAYKHGVHDVLTGVAMAGAIAGGGPFAVMLIPALDYWQVGESYDMIIGVDGSRVTNFLDFQDRMRDLQPGEVIYLSVLRDGKRLQVTMPVPANILQATN